MDWTIFITVILKEELTMNKTDQTFSKLSDLVGSGISRLLPGNNDRQTTSQDKIQHPFLVILNKEISDHVSSWRFIILILLISLMCLGSIYTALPGIGKSGTANDPDGAFFFLKLFTLSDGTLPSFVVFISFLGPLLGISLGFDAVNSEYNHRTLSRILAQPIYRDYLLNAKFLAALSVISVMFLALGLLVIGFGLVSIGIPPSVDEFLRIFTFVGMSILYVAFWLNLSIFFSVQFRQPATSAFAGIAVWIFFSIFYGMIVNLITRGITPSSLASDNQIIAFESFKLALLRVMPTQLFSEATTTLLMPSVRSLGPLSMEQVQGTIPGPLPFSQSLLLVWPQVTGLLAATVICFALSYFSFMRREIRSR